MEQKYLGFRLLIKLRDSAPKTNEKHSDVIDNLGDKDIFIIKKAPRLQRFIL